MYAHVVLAGNVQRRQQLRAARATPSRPTRPRSGRPPPCHRVRILTTAHPTYCRRSHISGESRAHPLVLQSAAAGAIVDRTSTCTLCGSIQMTTRFPPQSTHEQHLGTFRGCGRLLAHHSNSLCNAERRRDRAVRRHTTQGHLNCPYCPDGTGLTFHIPTVLTTMSYAFPVMQLNIHNNGQSTARWSR